MNKLIGRKYEQRQIQKAYDSSEAELIAVYGRRRVGKTYLIRQFFSDKDCVFFQITGIHNASLSVQLKEFKKEVERSFFSDSKNIALKEPDTWLEALGMLTDAINLRGEHQKVVIFFDEFPWMATAKSGLLQAFDYYWNRFWVNDPKLKFVVCGSAASWILKNIINNKRGLHNRVTLRVHLEPFTLSETKEYLKHKGVLLDNTQILDLYMCIGGIPYYLKFVEKGLSAIQNINQLCFQKKGTLLDEFKNLFSSLFDHSEVHEAIIKAIASKREGLSRAEIEVLTESKGGRLTVRLKELEEAGFIMGFIPWGRERGMYYKVIDEYTLFYINWISPEVKSRISKEISSEYWNQISQTQAWKSWAGHSFEAVCYKHLTNIRKTLQIAEAATATTWRYSPKKGEEGAQIDLLFDRPDGIVTICEIKYRKEPYVIDKAYARELLRKVDIYRKVIKTDKQIFISMVTSFKLKRNMYSEELIASEVGLEDLFL